MEWNRGTWASPGRRSQVRLAVWAFVDWAALRMHGCPAGVLSRPDFLVAQHQFNPFDLAIHRYSDWAEAHPVHVARYSIGDHAPDIVTTYGRAVNLQEVGGFLAFSLNQVDMQDGFGRTALPHQ